MENNSIIFGGDSFTWGEGLELYLDTLFWINERHNLNRWSELEPKQTLESAKFRESNRFAGIVSKYFDCNKISLDYNGGGFDEPALLINDNLNKNPKSIVYQFTTFNRMNLHFDRFCKCEFCNSKYASVRVYNLYLETALKKLNNIKLTDSEHFHLNWLIKNKNIPDSNLFLNKIEIENNYYFDNKINELMDLFIPIFEENLDIFINEYLNKWLETTTVYLIDSWDEYTSELLFKNPTIEKYLIKLKGFDGNYYKKWKDWERTFPHRRIENEFPNTRNGHSTLLQHQYIADSIIEYMKN
jgi:hypothetical protein